MSAILKVRDENGNLIEIPAIVGPQGKTGPQGETGPAGYSPVKGTDYWTEEDVAEIQEYVDGEIAKIPTPDVSGQIGEHNTYPEAHADIREAIADVIVYVDEHAANIPVSDTAPEDADLWIDTSVEGGSGGAVNAYTKEETDALIEEAVSAMDTRFADNITGGSENDTVAFWKEKGSGYCWFSELNQIVGQPSQYGFVISYTNGVDVFQIFRDQMDGITYYRSGDAMANDWFANWTEVVIKDSDGIIHANGLYTTHVEVSDGNTKMSLYSNGLGAEGDAVWIDQAGDAYFTKVNIGTKGNYKKAATEEYVDDKISEIPTPDVSGQIGAHNTATDAHSDIRKAVSDHAGSKNNPHGVTAAQVGAIPLTGGRMTGDLENTRNIVLAPSTTGNFARGLHVRVNEGTTTAGVTFGGDANGADVVYIGVTDGTDGAHRDPSKVLTVTKDNIAFKNNAIYHVGNKPTAADIGAANATHDQAASTVTAGTFAGQVVANASGQTPSTSLLRNSKLVSADTNPTVNGEICWTYK